MDLSNAPAAALAVARGPDAEALRYARLLDWGNRVGLALLLVSFVLYGAGALPPHVPLDRLPQLWVHPVERYLALTGSPTGWSWLTQLHRGDLLGLAGIAVLAGCSVVCLVAVALVYRRSGDRIYPLLCAAEIAVLLLAASGLIGAGH
jgi:hypothetical protein